MIYIVPVNLKRWNMLEKVEGPGHVETFLATKSMVTSDLVLLHVGQQDSRYESGVYALGTIVDGPYVIEGRPDDYCNGKLSVMVRIDRISHSAPLISHDDCRTFTGQFRSVHRIDPRYNSQVEMMLGE